MVKVRERVQVAVRGLRAEGYADRIDVVVDGVQVLVRGRRAEGTGSVKIEVGRGRAKPGEWEGVDPGTLAGIATQELATVARDLLTEVLAADPADDIPPMIHSGADQDLPAGPTLFDVLRALGACRAEMVLDPLGGADVTLSSLDGREHVGEWFAVEGKTFWAAAYHRTGAVPTVERIGSDRPLTAIVRSYGSGGGRAELIATRVVRSEGRAIVTTRAAYRSTDWARRGTKGEPTELIGAFAHDLGTVHGGPNWKAFLPSVANARLAEPAGDVYLALMEDAAATLKRLREWNPAGRIVWAGPSSPIRACYLARDGFAFVLTAGLGESFHIVDAVDLGKIADVLEAWGTPAPGTSGAVWANAVRVVCPGTSFWRAQAAADALKADADAMPNEAGRQAFGAGVADGAVVVYSKTRSDRDRLTAAIGAARTAGNATHRTEADDESWSVLSVGTLGGRVPGGAWVGHRHGGGPLAPMFVFGNEVAAIEYFQTGTANTTGDACRD